MWDHIHAGCSFIGVTDSKPGAVVAGCDVAVGHLSAIPPLCRPTRPLDYHNPNELVWCSSRRRWEQVDPIARCHRRQRPPMGLVANEGVLNVQCCEVVDFRMDNEHILVCSCGGSAGMVVVMWTAMISSARRGGTWLGGHAQPAGEQPPRVFGSVFPHDSVMSWSSAS